ncbi:hypothetical protein FAUST_1853 [Fusarium austroamericanum]|uniref:FAR1 domain-containing protein n=1 Tax=Fusarium austroamericanum TaxID=282268 RepID=A0AAN6HJ76_FUSAU|nr:hypothetical protein FAUST_1853 [Fusarium austroamericanum]
MDPIDVSNSFPDDILPPECIYPSRKDLVTAINAWARDRGYTFVVKNSWKTASGRTRALYACGRGTKPPSTTKIRKRNTTSRYTGCLFSILAKEEACRTAWAVKYRPDHSNHQHNHEPSKAVAHPAHRATPKVITLHLRNTTGTLATQKDIYNCIAQGKRELVQGQSNIHALKEQLESPASSRAHTTETTTETTTKTITITTTSPVARPSTATAQSEADTLSYTDARAIYQRYKADREACKAEYDWCLGWKEMGKQCRTGRSLRDWTKEEMMSYLDFDRAENERVDKQVEEELKARRFTTYRGPDHVWKAAARDHKDQQRVHENRNRRI